MDTSIAEDRIAYILTGRLLSGLTPNEWLCVVKDQLRRYKPYLKYLPAITDHATAVQMVREVCGGLTAEDRRDYQEVEVHYPQRSPHLNPKTRLLPLVALSPWSYHGRDGKIPWENDRIAEAVLCISPGLKWIRLERVVERSCVDNFTPHPKMTFHTRSLTFTLISETDALNCIGDRSYRWHRILTSLDWLMAQTIAKKRERTLRMEEALDGFAAVKARIKKPLVE